MSEYEVTLHGGATFVVIVEAKGHEDAAELADRRLGEVCGAIEQTLPRGEGWQVVIDWKEPGFDPEVEELE